MQELPMFVPECWIDTALMRTLLHDRRLYNHQHGISKVGGTMERQAGTFGAGRVVVGMVDRDKKFEENTYLRAFDTAPARAPRRRHAPRPASSHPADAAPDRPQSCLRRLGIPGRPGRQPRSR